MIINLSKQAQQRIGKPELVVITERVDDVALLLAQMINMGLPAILDRHLPNLNTLAQHDVRVFRTDRHGAITAVSDGERYWVETLTAYAGSPPPVRIPPRP